MASDRVKFYLDVHIAEEVASALRREGVDVVRGVEIGLADATDRVHLARANEEGRAIVTQDRDYLAFHRQGLAHHGICYTPQGTKLRYMIRELLLVHAIMLADELQGSVYFL